MRTTIGLAATLATLAIAGCGDQHARRAASTDFETPASYDTIAADRTRGRDEDMVTPGGVDVQAAYDRQRTSERAAGRFGTVGESERAGLPAAGALSSNADPSRGGFAGTTPGSFGGTSSGGEAPRPGSDVAPGGGEGAPAASAPAGVDQPIPYAGSREIAPWPYPGVPTGGNGAGAARSAPRTSRPATGRDAENRTFGIPAHPEAGAMTMPQSNAGATIQGPEGPATGPTAAPPPRSTQRSGY